MSSIDDLLQHAAGEYTLENFPTTIYGADDDVDIMYLKVLRKWMEMKPTSRFEYRSRLSEFVPKFVFRSLEMHKVEMRFKTVSDFFRSSDCLFEYLGKARDICLLVNHKNLFDVIYQDLAEAKPLSVSMIMEYHSILLAGCYYGTIWDSGERPGSLKKNPSPPGLDLEAELNRIIMDLYYQSNQPIHTKLSTVSKFYLDFMFLSPFAIGNDVLCRVLSNYLLMYFGLPPVVFNKYYEEQLDEARAIYFSNRPDLYEFNRCIEKITNESLWGKGV